MFFFRPVLIDEGIGSFNSDKLLREEADKMVSLRVFQLALWRLFQLLWRSLPLFGGTRVSLFSFRNGKPEVNEIVAQSYREAFRAGHLQRDEVTSLAPNTILILTQPFVEMGVCTESELLDQLKPWVEHAKLLGAHPLLKPHPAESSLKYKSLQAECVKYSGPVEELLATEGDSLREVWGFNSTSLITARALFGIHGKRIPTPWRQASVQIFQGQALALFSFYTEQLSLDKNQPYEF
jgi:hypothetical protein